MSQLRTNYWPRWLRYGLSIGVTWLVLHTVLITLDGLHDDGWSARLGVVLGNRVNADGTLSERLRQRLRCGLRLYRAGRVRQLVVSGGLGQEGFYEGDKMRDYLRQQGVPDSAIIVDNEGSTTRQTARNVRRLGLAGPDERVIVVSQFYHLTRTKMLFRQAGFAHVSGVSPGYFEWRDAYSLLREFAAYYPEWCARRSAFE